MPEARKLIDKFKRLKILPHVALHLMQLISDPATSVTDLEAVIRLDPTLVVRLLRLINSAYCGLVETVDSISMAVAYLGLKTLRNMVVLASLKEIFQQGHESDVFSRNMLWFHCSVVSLCSQMISERLFKRNGEDAFLCGILHDVGMIVEDQVVPDQLDQACRRYQTDTQPFIHYERQLIGTDHCKIGALLSEKWKVPPAVREAIRWHHRPEEDVAPASLTGIIQISEYIAWKHAYVPIRGTTVVLPASLRSHIYENVSKYKTLIKDFPGELSKAKELYQLC